MSAGALCCEPAALDWSQPGGPRSVQYGDVYFSAEDGLAETRDVFLKACGLPEAWRSRSCFTIGELGFGTGLNALAVWDLWRREGEAAGWLHFVSVEKHPLTRADAARAFAAWPDLKPLSDRLLANWPTLMKGPHRLVFPEDRVSITVFQDEALAALGQMEIAADCWFLDGFAPAMNEAMWSQEILDQVGRLSVPGARIGTFTVAGHVRRGLAAAGFQVSKQPGFGRKRERLEAIFAGRAPEPAASAFERSRPVDGPVAILGAGIAGASMALALARRGREVMLFDAHGAAAGASGAPAGLLTPRLERADRPHVRATLAAFDFARRLYDGRDGFHAEGVIRLAKDGTEAGRLDAIASLIGEGYGFAGDRLTMAQAGRIEPTRLVGALLDGRAVRQMDVQRIEALPERVRLIGPAAGESVEAAAVIDARGHAAGALSQISSSAGYVGVFEGGTPAQSITWGGYACAAPRGGCVLGTTHVKGEDPGDAGAAIEEIRAGAEPRIPDLLASLSDEPSAVWSGVRATTPDRLPAVGAVPDEGFEARWGPVARGEAKAPLAVEPRTGRQFVLSGFGSRGFAHAPLLAEALASEICGEPSPLERAGREALHPARFAWRAAKRRN